MIKHCFNCAYKHGGKCALSGVNWTVERQYPTICGKNFERWVEKPMPQWKLAVRWLLIPFIRAICTHEYALVRNIHGDEIIISGARSIHRCSKCGKIKYSKILDEVGE